jgi:amidase
MYFTLFLASCLALVGAQQIDFLTATVADLLSLLESETVTSVQLVESFLSRIDENNHQGLLLRAVIETAPYENIIQIAQSCDADRQQGISRGPLHGIPILVKDTIATDVSLGMNTTAGSFALRITFTGFK